MAIRCSEENNEEDSEERGPKMHTCLREQGEERLWILKKEEGWKGWIRKRKALRSCIRAECPLCESLIFTGHPYIRPNASVHETAESGLEGPIIGLILSESCHQVSSLWLP
jgi:hypothetical protein